MKSLEQTYGAEKAKAIKEAVEGKHLSIKKAVVSIAAEKARQDEDVKIEYPRVDILDEAGALALYGSPEKYWADTTYAFDLGIRSKSDSNSCRPSWIPTRKSARWRSWASRPGCTPTKRRPSQRSRRSVKPLRRRQLRRRVRPSRRPHVWGLAPQGVSPHTEADDKPRKGPIPWNTNSSVWVGAATNGGRKPSPTST